MRTLFQRCAGGGGDMLPNYWNPHRADPEIILPTTNRSTTLIYGVAAWGAYAQIDAATAADYVLGQVHFSKVLNALCSYWIEIAIGAAGAEVPLCYVGDSSYFAGAGASIVDSHCQRVGPYTIPAGSRVSCRGYTTAGSAGGRLALSLFQPAPLATWYDPWPNTYIDGARVTGPHRRDPAVPGFYGPIAQTPNWTQIAAAAPNDMLFDAVEWNTPLGAGGNGIVVEIGVGAAGAEVVFSRVPLLGMGILAFVIGTHQAARKSLILAGERVAARLAFGVAGQTCAFYFEDL